jgi:hypothetical protein
MSTYFLHEIGRPLFDAGDLPGSPPIDGLPYTCYFE